MLYFAYGMNMTSKTMTDLFKENVVAVGPAVLPDYKLAMRGYADIEESPGDEVLGVLWHINEMSLYSLDKREGYPAFYTRFPVSTVRMHNSIQTCSEAWVYQMKAENVSHMLDYEPIDSYLELMREGRREFGLPVTDLA